MLESNELFVNANAIPSLPGLTQELGILAKSFSSKGSPLTLGVCLKALSDQGLVNTFKSVIAAREDTQVLVALSLFGVHLANNEGLVVRGTDDIGRLVSTMGQYVQSEALVRRGYVALQYAFVSIEEFDSSLLSLTEEGKEAGVRLVFKSIPLKNKG